MSLLSDPDYLIHQLRLTYLRHVDDPYGPRMLSLSPGYMSNQHILASGLADQELWQELTMPGTPGEIEIDSSKDEKRHSGFPGAPGLRYTQTIVNQTRSAGLGMRVNAKRTSFAKETVQVTTDIEVNGRRHRADSEPTPVAASPAARSLDPRPDKPGAATLLRRQSIDAGELEEASSEIIQNNRVEPFRPPFARAAEMEARRQLRLKSRRLASVTSEQTAVEEKTAMEMSDEEMLDDDDLLDDDTLDVAEDGLDTSFGPRIVLDASVSDGALSTGNSGMSTSHSSGIGQYIDSDPNVRSIGRSRLSPVHEGRSNLPSEEGQPLTPHHPSDTLTTPITPQRTYKSDDSYFVLVVPPSQSRNQSPSAGRANPSSQKAHDTPTSTSPLRPVQNFVPSLSFSRVKVPPVPDHNVPSALSIILASKATKVENPFSELYSLISSRSNPLKLQVIYPFSTESKKAVTLNVRSDATVEEIIGFALWTYWEEGFTPKLGESDEARKKDRLSAAGWSLRITEDGEVDDDFPAMDRMLRMSKFNFEGYAILPETPAQTEQNRSAEAKIVRRPSRVLVSKKKAEPTLASPSTHVPVGSSGATQPSLSVSLGGGSSISPGPQQFLRVKVPGESSSVIHFSTTIPVKDSMYMEEALESVCRRRRIAEPKQWCLVYEMKLLVPPDRTIASLQGHRELYLVNREELPLYPEIREIPRSTDPNASIFNRNSEVPEQQYSAALDFTRAYKKYTVYRKMPMLVVRHERTLAIDGDYIHLMPPSTKGFLDSMKTSSYHIKSVMACTQSAKSSSNFKLVVARDGGNKRYDFEAENPKIAAEIVRHIRDLRNKRLERYSVGKGASRRSRPPI